MFAGDFALSLAKPIFLVSDKSFDFHRTYSKSKYLFASFIEIMAAYMSQCSIICNGLIQGKKKIQNQYKMLQAWLFQKQLWRTGLVYQF